MRAESDAWLASDRAIMRVHTAREDLDRADISETLRPLDGAVDEQVLDKSASRPPFFDLPKRSRRTRLLAVAAVLLDYRRGPRLPGSVSQIGVAWFMETEFGGFQRVAWLDGSTAMLNHNRPDCGRGLKLGKAGRLCWIGGGAVNGGA